MTDCIFCRIVQKEIPATVVYEDTQVIAFRDIQPAAPTHILVIPKIHVDNIVDPAVLNDGLPSALFAAVQRVAEQEKLTERGFRTVINCGKDAGEAVHHLHIHLIAGRSLGWPPG